MAQPPEPQINDNLSAEERAAIIASLPVTEDERREISRLTVPKTAAELMEMVKSLPGPISDEQCEEILDAAKYSYDSGTINAEEYAKLGGKPYDDYTEAVRAFASGEWPDNSDNSEPSAARDFMAGENLDEKWLLASKMPPDDVDVLVNYGTADSWFASNDAEPISAAHRKFVSDMFSVPSASAALLDTNSIAGTNQTRSELISGIVIALRQRSETRSEYMFQLLRTNIAASSAGDARSITGDEAKLLLDILDFASGVEPEQAPAAAPEPVEPTASPITSQHTYTRRILSAEGITHQHVPTSTARPYSSDAVDLLQSITETHPTCPRLNAQVLLELFDNLENAPKFKYIAGTLLVYTSSKLVAFSLVSTAAAAAADSAALPTFNHAQVFQKYGNDPKWANLGPNMLGVPLVRGTSSSVTYGTVYLIYTYTGELIGEISDAYLVGQLADAVLADDKITVRISEKSNLTYCPITMQATFTGEAEQEEDDPPAGGWCIDCYNSEPMPCGMCSVDTSYSETMRKNTRYRGWKPEGNVLF